MGLCSSTSTSKTEIPEASPQEQEFINLMSDTLFPIALEEQGYEVNTNTTTLEDDPKYKTAKDQFDSYQNRYNELQSQIVESQQSGRPLVGAEGERIRREMAGLQNKMDVAQKRMNEAEQDFTPTTTYDTRKLDAPEVELVRQQYGADSQQYKDAQKAYQEKKAEMSIKQQAVQEKFIAAADKYLSGDFSITEEQRQQIEENLAPVRAAVNDMFAKAKENIGKEETRVEEGRNVLLQEISNQFTNFRKAAEQTKMDTFTALDVVGKQILDTGANMKTALENTVKINQELLKMGIEDYTGDVIRNVSENAAAMGRSPDDPEFQNQIAENIARQVKEGQLNLAAMEAQGKLAIEERTGSGLEGIAKSKADVTMATGEKMEQAALSEGQSRLSVQDQAEMRRLGLQEKRTQVGMLEGEAKTDIERQAANIRQNVGMGLPANQIQVGMSVGQYNQALEQTRIANAQSALNTPLPLVNYYSRERYAQPTTTQTQKGSVIGTVAGFGTGIASAYSGLSQAGSYNTMADYYRNRG